MKPRIVGEAEAYMELGYAIAASACSEWKRLERRVRKMEANGKMSGKAHDLTAYIRDEDERWLRSDMGEMCSGMDGELVMKNLRKQVVK